eukprot:gene23058-biopygen8826
MSGRKRTKKTTKIALKHAPQRRVYARSLQKGLLDNTHGILDKKPVESPRNTRHGDGFMRARSRSVPSMVHTGVHKKWYFQFPPGRLLDRAHARKMRIFRRLTPDSWQGGRRGRHSKFERLVINVTPRQPLRATKGRITLVDASRTVTGAVFANVYVGQKTVTPVGEETGDILTADPVSDSLLYSLTIGAFGLDRTTTAARRVDPSSWKGPRAQEELSRILERGAWECTPQMVLEEMAEEVGGS